MVLVVIVVLKIEKLPNAHVLLATMTKHKNHFVVLTDVIIVVIKILAQHAT